MTSKKGRNDVNEELPDEHEVIQHSLRDSSDKPQQNKTPVKNYAGAQKPEGSRLNDAGSSSNREEDKNKPQ